MSSRIFKIFLKIVLVATVTLVTFSGALNTENKLEKQKNESSKIVKRQASSSVHMQQSTYRFTVPKCSPGSLVGKVAGTDARGAAVYYLIDSPNSNVAVNQKSGQILLINFLQPGSENTVVIRAASTSGSSLANVTYGCGSFPSSPVAGSSAPAMQSFFSFATKTCSPGSVVGSLSNTGSSSSCQYVSISNNPYYVVLSDGQIRLTTPTASSQTFTVRATCKGQAGQASKTSTVQVFSSCPNFPIFSLPSYTFTLTTCQQGETVGSVTASNAIVFTIEGPGSPFFAIAPATGLIRSTAVLNSATYFLVVRAYSGTGASSATTVRVAAPQCGSSTPLRFFADSYTFAPTNCSANAFIGQVGTIGGLTATSYSVDNPTGVYAVGFMSGAISAVGNPIAGTLTIRAMNSGKSITVPVTVSLDSCQIMSSNRRLNSVGPIFGQSNYLMTAASCNSSTAIGQVFATSRLQDTNVTYSIESGNPEIRVGEISGIISLEGSLKSSGKAVILATDSDGNSNNAFLIVKCGVSSSSTGGAPTTTPTWMAIPSGVDIG